MESTQIPSVDDPLIPNFLRISTVGTPLRYKETASIWISFENIQKPHELDLLQLMGFSSDCSWQSRFLFIVRLYNRLLPWLQLHQVSNHYQHLRKNHGWPLKLKYRSLPPDSHLRPHQETSALVQDSSTPCSHYSARTLTLVLTIPSHRTINVCISLRFHKDHTSNHTSMLGALLVLLRAVD